jgi:hypothetical protein
MLVSRQGDAYHARLQERSNLLAARIRRDGDDGHVANQKTLAFELADLAGALQAVHYGHLLVHENDADVDGIGAVALPVAGLLQRFDGFTAVVGYIGLDAAVLELTTENLLIDWDDRQQAARRRALRYLPRLSSTIRTLRPETDALFLLFTALSCSTAAKSFTLGSGAWA